MRKILQNLLLISFLFTLSTQVKAQVPKLQSVFIYNFTKYIDWPAEYKTGNFVVGVLGDATITRELQKMARTKKAGTQTIEIKTFKTVADVSKCHILFIPSSKSSFISQIAKKVGAKSTLIIGEKEGLTRNGAAINFVLKDNKQKFELSKKNAAKHKLKVSSSLEKLAIIVD